MIFFYTILFIAQSFAEPLVGNTPPKQQILADGGKKGNGNGTQNPKASGNTNTPKTTNGNTSNTLNQNATSTSQPPKQEPVCEHMINGMVYLNVVNLPVTDIIKRIACYTKRNFILTEELKG